MKHGKKLWAGLMAGVLCVSLCACGASAGGTKGYDRQENGFYYSADTAAPMEPGAVFDSVVRGEADFKSDGVVAEGSTVYRNEGVKLIRRANLTVQTTEFDAAVAALEKLVTELGGYYENAEIYGGSIHNQNASRSGNYTVRIPAGKYDTFMTQVDGIGYLSHKNESTEDVGEVYYDIETRLKTQRTKQERLLELLKKAQSMEDIIALENALTDVEYHIEQFSSDLNRYDGLVSFATIHVSLNEMIRIKDEPGEKEGLLTRMGAGVVSSAKDLVDGVQDVLVWASYNLFGLLVFAAAVTGGVFAGRRWIKKKKVAKEGKTEE